MKDRIGINIDEYRDKVSACWYGKNIGGTLGAPFEWFRQENNITFYTQDLEGNPAPNDDLDIQLLWLIALEEAGIGLDEHLLADYWCNYVTPHWSEYGIAKINMRTGLLPPVCGTHRNEYKDSCGAFIRSEIWACIAPGCPDIAAEYARKDGSLDHGMSEGTFAEIFCAALESAAFLIQDLRMLIKIGLSYIPSDCGVAEAVGKAMEYHDQGMNLSDSRIEILKNFRGGTSLGNIAHTCESDRALGLEKGRNGYDAPSNIAILIWSLLEGQGDFGKTVCACVNMGEDTDCTAATAGSIFGLIHGMKGIEQKWIKPIGQRIVTGCLNLGELGFYGAQLPQDIEELTQRTEKITRQVLLANPMCRISLVDKEIQSFTDADSLMKRVKSVQLNEVQGYIVRHSFPFFIINVDYGDDPYICSCKGKEIKITIENMYKFQANLNFHWYLPESWRISPSIDGQALSLTKWQSGDLVLRYTLECDQVQKKLSRCVLEITAESRPLIMLVPIQLLNGDLPVELTEFHPESSPINAALFGET